MIRGPLGPELASALALKFALLALLYLLFFGPDARPAIDAERVAGHLLQPASGSAAADSAR